MAKEKYPNLNLIPVLSRINNDRSKSSKVESNAYVINNFGDLYKHENSKEGGMKYANL